ncbi:MAG TPA: FliM/FliN family flagellar motor switch protein [Candidatus Eisenbacteria bacterium]|nr:FliM/FliN family flagellar motor switch protein [Candidatus Eisenbacteria bacterium]
MSDILTPAEVEALLAAFSSEGPGERHEPIGSVRTIDLMSSERPLAGRLPGLELVLGRFARGVRGALATFFGDVPGVTVTATDLVRFERVLGKLEQPVGLVRFRLTPLRGHGLLAVPASLVGALLQVACGGTAGRAVAMPVREFSAIEQRLIERLAQRVLAELHAAFEPVASVECGYVRIESSPLFATIAAPDELVVQVELAVAVDGLAPATLVVALPNASLDAIRASLQTVRAVDDGASPAPDASWAARLRDRLADVPVDVTVDLGTQRMALSRLVSLAVGDVLSLTTGRDGPVVMRVAGAPHFVGAPGVVNGNNAVRVTARI